jgi:hypothetical protein
MSGLSLTKPQELPKDSVRVNLAFMWPLGIGISRLRELCEQGKRHSGCQVPEPVRNQGQKTQSRHQKVPIWKRSWIHGWRWPTFGALRSACPSATPWGRTSRASIPPEIPPTRPVQAKQLQSARTWLSWPRGVLQPGRLRILLLHAPVQALLTKHRQDQASGKAPLTCIIEFACSCDCFWMLYTH